MNKNNLTKIETTIQRKNREILLRQRGAVIWFTGLSGAGKSTLANALETRLIGHGKLTYLLDGDNVRHGLNRDLGFSFEDRMENIRRISEAAKLFVHCGVICISAFITPFRQSRELIRSIIGQRDLLIIYVSTPLSVCEARDPKGLYLKARQGKIADFTGISSPYEEPVEPDLALNTDVFDVQDCIEKIINLLIRRKIIPEFHRGKM